MRSASGPSVVAALRALLAVAALAAPASGATLSFEPNSLVVGGSFSVDIVVTGLNGYTVTPASPTFNCDALPPPSGPYQSSCLNQVVSAYDLTVTFNPAIVQVTGISFGNALDQGVPGDSFQNDSLSDPGLVVPAGGQFRFLEFSFLFDHELDLPQGDSFTLATLYFNPLSVGMTQFGFLGNLPLGCGGPGFPCNSGPGDTKGLNATPIDLSMAVDPADITVVPEPGTLLLLMSGLAGLAIARRRRLL